MTEYALVDVKKPPKTMTRPFSLDITNGKGEVVGSATGTIRALSDQEWRTAVYLAITSQTAAYKLLEMSIVEIDVPPAQFQAWLADPQTLNKMLKAIYDIQAEYRQEQQRIADRERLIEEHKDEWDQLRSRAWQRAYDEMTGASDTIVGDKEDKDGDSPRE